jgi:putative transcriptional regulator
MASTLQNHFLVAMPTLTDSFFYRSVVYLCEHDQNGAMGLIINRPTKVMLEELLSHLEIDNHADSIKTTPVLFGGPIQKGQGMVIHDQSEIEWKSSLQLTDDVILTTSTDILEAIGTEQGPDHVLVTLGYAGWGAGQLEQELAENSWLTVPATHQLLFDTPAEERWQAAAKLLGVDINLISNTTGHA